MLATMLQGLIARMKHTSADVRSEAGGELAKLARSGTLRLEDAAALMEAAAGEFPKTEDEWDDPSSRLLCAARDIARDKDPQKLFPTVRSRFGAYTKQAKSAALQILTLADTRDAAELYLHLLRQHQADLSSEFIPTFEAKAGREVAGVLFPALLDLARHPNIGYKIFNMLLEFRQLGHLPPDIAKKHHQGIAYVLRAEIGSALRLQQPTGLGWKDESPYSEHRDMIGLLFDLAGYLDSKSILAVVSGSHALADPRLRRFRAVSLLRRGVDVPQQELDWIATSPRDRFALFSQLHGMDLADRLPESCLDQTLLAEGHMVDWLCFVTELAREPNEIVLFATETRARSTGPRLVAFLSKRKKVDYFFFRYRVTEEHWSQKDGWMVGMAGGYARDEQPTTDHDGATFSTFGSWESKTPEEHVADYLS
jgi:hypothetical protein